ncbi:hypothetical protein RRF57_009552 [Xylaria bambusicola]|uniref:Uncharacterized protein n=1 Tax=Xylaria bambusicola TaxID=326684 RepID=A0AAN7UQC8_9PEZI
MQHDNAEVQQDPNQTFIPVGGCPPPYNESTPMPQPTAAQNGDRFTDVSVCFFIDQDLNIYHNTISIQVNITNPPTYDKFLDKIAAAAVLSGPLPLVYKERDILALATREFKASLRRENTTLLIWTIAPYIKIRKNIFYVSSSGVSDGCRFSHEEFVRILHLIEYRKVCNVFINTFLARTSVGGTKLEHLKHLHPDVDG